MDATTMPGLTVTEESRLMRWAKRESSAPYFTEPRPGIETLEPTLTPRPDAGRSLLPDLRSS